MKLSRHLRFPSRPVALLTLALCGAAPAQTAALQTVSPLTLDDALSRLEAVPSVTAARLSVQTAQTSLNAARTALGLTVSVNGNAGYTGPSTATAADGTATASSLSGAAGVNVSLGLLP